MGCTLKDMGFLEPGCNVYMKNTTDILVLKSQFFECVHFKTSAMTQWVARTFFSILTFALVELKYEHKTVLGVY